MTDTGIRWWMHLTVPDAPGLDLGQVEERGEIRLRHNRCHPVASNLNRLGTRGMTAFVAEATGVCGAGQRSMGTMRPILVSLEVARA